MPFIEGGCSDARVACQGAPLLHDALRDRPGRYRDLASSVYAQVHVPDRGGRAADPPGAQARLPKGRMMDVVNVLGREPAMYIGGSWVRAAETRPVINPADESVIAAVPEADEGHAERAREAARRAQREWSRRSGPERGAVLKAIADRIRTRQEEL